MTPSPARAEATPSAYDRLPGALVAAALALLGPVAALAPRGLPVWAILATLAALWSLLREGRAATLAVGYAEATIAALVVLAAASVVWSPSGRDAATAAEMAYVAVGALVVGRWIATRPAAEADRLLRLFAAGLAAGGAVILVEAIADHPLHRWWNAVPPGEPVDNTNVPKRTAAVFALLAWPAALLVRHHAGTLAALAAPAAVALISLPLGSRSALLGLGVGAAAFALARASARWTRRLIACALAAAFALAVPAALALKHGFRLDEADWLFTSARHRVEIWGHAAARVLDRPLFGHGIDASRALPPKPGEVSQFGPLGETLLPLHPHNAFLQVWLELGAVGAALALGAALAGLAATARLAPAAQPYALALYACGLAMAATAYGLWQAWWMAAFLAGGLAMALAVRAGDRR